MNKCIICAKEWSALRKTARFCSGACRVKFNRAKVSVTKTPELVTLRVDDVTLSPDKPAKDVTLSRKDDTLSPENVTLTPHCADCGFYMQYVNGLPWIPNWFKFHLKGKVKSRDDAYTQVRAYIEANYERISSVGLT